jgi:hypothetical protein
MVPSTMIHATTIQHATTNYIHSTIQRYTLDTYNTTLHTIIQQYTLTSVLHHHDREMTGKLDSKIIRMIPMYKSKWRENVVTLCIYSYVQLRVIEG